MRLLTLPTFLGSSDCALDAGRMARKIASDRATTRLISSLVAPDFSYNL